MNRLIYLDNSATTKPSKKAVEYINKALCKEENLENAFCAKWKQFYVIAINGKLYLLDTSRKSYEKGEPLSAFQYECYLWTGINARVIWEEDGVLFRSCS